MSFAALTAATLMKPTSEVRSVALREGGKHQMRMRVDQSGDQRRPLPSMQISVAFSFSDARIGVGEMAFMRLPLTSTKDGAESASDLPSNMRTFSKRIAGGAVFRARGGGAKSLRP